MLKIRSAVMETFLFKERLYKPYVDIINMHWDKHFPTHIHAIAYLLSPTFAYEPSFEVTQSMSDGLIDMLGLKDQTTDLNAALGEIKVYREHLGSFSRPSARSSRKKMQCVEYKLILIVNFLANCLYVSNK